MRKTLALVLAAAMMLSICCFGVSAADGTAINSAADFLNMKADGTYYLNADISISASYEEKFTGVFDGNGHTVTVTAPMFAIFDGTIKNLTVVGEIKVENTSASAIAVRTVDGMYAENITTDVDITVTGNINGLYAAGILATDNIVAADNTANWAGKQPENNTAALSIFVNCVNKGDITVHANVPTEEGSTITASTMKPRAAGIAGVTEGSIFVKCSNSGNIIIPISENCTSAISGGIAARVGLTAGANPNEAYECVNSGEVEAWGNSGGIFSYCGTSGNACMYKMYGCVNSGKITARNQAGGIAAYEYGQSTQFTDIEFCVNTGDLYYGKTDGASSYASNFIAYTNTTMTTITYNLGLGQYHLLEDATLYSSAVISCSSAEPLNYLMEENYIYDPNGTITDYSDANSEANRATHKHTLQEGLDQGLITIIKTLDDVKSGKLAYDMNEACGEALADVAEYEAGGSALKFEYSYMWHQALGSDDYPNVNNVENTYVALENGTYKNVKELAVETTEAPVATTKKAAETKAPETEAPAETEAAATEAAATEAATQKAEEKKSGCGSAIGFAVVLALVPAALCIRKKED